MIGAISLHFLCVSGPETHEKCKEIAPIIAPCYIKSWNSPNLYVSKHKDWCNFVAYFVRFSAPEKHKKCNEIAPIIVLCYIRIGNVPNFYVTK